MAILPTWDQFRWVFSIGGAASNQLHGTTAAVALTYNAGPPATITRGAGTFLGEFHVGGQYEDITGTANNNKRVLTDTTVAATITLDSSETLIAEGPVASNLLGVFRDNDMVEQFPSEFGNTNLVRSGGFTGGFSNIDPGMWGLSVLVSVNSAVADAVPFVDEYNWYLSQRTNTPAEQWLAITSQIVLPNTYSGSVNLVGTALAMSELGFTSPSDITMNMVRELYKHCHLYCQRITDGAIQWIDLYKGIQPNL